MFSTFDQPYLSFIFASGGMTAYFAYEVFYAVKTFFSALGGKRTKLSKTSGTIIGFFCDFSSVVLAFGLYLLLTERYNYGKIEFFTAFSFLFGAVLMRLVLKNTVRRLFTRLADFVARKVSAFRKKANNYFVSSQAKIKRRLYDRRKEKLRKRNDLRLRRKSMRLQRESVRLRKERKQVRLRSRATVRF